MNEEEVIRRYGKEAYAKWLQQKREWKRNHREEEIRGF